ncbi:hypothetical protein [Clostridium sp.]|uniref:hypothetical protein n=1 Tax=Clostridium sp. TaxID=1506 RepID=UPI001A54C5D5|nr:hypothetical protein [Clostridium sp.]MBK5237088.1 hypothetical protein [Clostridium sp.]
MKIGNMTAEGCLNVENQLDVYNALKAFISKDGEIQQKSNNDKFKSNISTS